ncbi:MAG: TRAP transporter substrate-binding protein DctP [Paracoccaceae bacterium]
MNRLLLSAASAALLTGAPALADELRMIGSFPEGFVFTDEIAVPFMDAVSAATDGAVTVSFTGPDAVSPLEQLEPVQAGVFDLLFTHPAYHAGTTSLGLAIDAVGTDPALRRDSGIIGMLDEHYQGLGLKLIAAPATGTQGFRYYLKEPIEAEPAFEGRKIRGTVSYHPMIEALGGTGVVMGGGEVYSALQTGVVDGAAWGTTGAMDFKWNEVAGYIADPVFGQVGVMILANLDAWEALSEEERAAIEQAAIELEAGSIARFDALADEELAALQEAGMQLTSFSEEEAANLDRMWSDGVWQVASGGAPEETAAMRAMAEEAGLAVAIE